MRHRWRTYGTFSEGQRAVEGGPRAESLILVVSLSYAHMSYALSSKVTYDLSVLLILRRDWMADNSMHNSTINYVQDICRRRTFRSKARLDGARQNLLVHAMDKRLECRHAEESAATSGAGRGLEAPSASYSDSYGRTTRLRKMVGYCNERRRTPL